MIDKKLIPYIEKALGIKLFDNVINNLTKDIPIYYNEYNRRRGKTTTFIIKFILENHDKTIRIDDLKRGRYTDEIWDNFYTNWYFNEFINIREKLKCNGFKVIKIE